MCKFTFLRILLKDTKLKNKLLANTKFIIARGISSPSQFKTIGSKPNQNFWKDFIPGLINSMYTMSQLSVQKLPV